MMPRHYAFIGNAQYASIAIMRSMRVFRFQFPFD